MAVRTDPFVAVSNLITSISVVAAAVAALAAAWAAWETRRAHQATLVLSFQQRYSAEVMRDSLRMLVAAAAQPGENMAAKWAEALTKAEPMARQLDGARRLVTYYFLDAYRLYKFGLLSKATLKAIAALDGLSVLTQVVRPMAVALNPGGMHEWMLELPKFVGQSSERLGYPEYVKLEAPFSESLSEERRDAA